MAEFPELPNFDVVRQRVKDPGALAWLDKLEAWCNAAVGALAREQSRVDQLEREIADGAHAQDHLEKLREDLDDVGRGIKTLEEVRRGC